MAGTADNLLARQGKGRPPGSLNKTTKEFRDTVTQLLAKNSENVEIWLERVANGHGETKPAPDKALDLLARLAEFAAPKLARTEVVGNNGGPIVISATPLDERL